jgi:hypothetical protein
VLELRYPGFRLVVGGRLGADVVFAAGNQMACGSTLSAARWIRGSHRWRLCCL